MSNYWDLGSFVAEYDRREANQAALTNDIGGDDDDMYIGDNDQDSE